jgi:hypothetical protein
LSQLWVEKRTGTTPNRRVAILQQSWKTSLFRHFSLAKDNGRAHQSIIEANGRGLVMLWVVKPKDDRQSISRKDLQSAITEAVKQSGPDYEGFVDVIVESDGTESKPKVNWAVRGIKFGNCDRKKGENIVAVIVARMQQEFMLDNSDRPQADKYKSIRPVSTRGPQS